MNPNIYCEANREATNLDAMDPAELREFGEGEPNDNLRFYAFTKANAMEKRLAGEIAEAINLECECERLYAALPLNLRW
jgi:hypothetical protein